MSTTVSIDLLKAYRCELDKKIHFQQSKSRYAADEVMDGSVGGFASLVTRFKSHLFQHDSNILRYFRHILVYFKRFRVF